MQEERYNVLLDIKKIKIVLSQIRLQDGKLRLELAKRLTARQIFKHRLGRSFVDSLYNESMYDTYEKQKMYLQKVQAYEKRIQKEKPVVGKQTDTELIHKITAKIDLNQQENVDRLYKYLKCSPRKIFQTWIGYGFIEELQRKTSQYRRIERYCNVLLVISIGCIVIGVVLLIVLFLLR